MTLFRRRVRGRRRPRCSRRRRPNRSISQDIDAPSCVLLEVRSSPLGGDRRLRCCGRPDCRCVPGRAVDLRIQERLGSAGQSARLLHPRNGEPQIEVVRQRRRESARAAPRRRRPATRACRPATRPPVPPPAQPIRRRAATSPAACSWARRCTQQRACLPRSSTSRRQTCATVSHEARSLHALPAPSVSSRWHGPALGGAACLPPMIFSTVTKQDGDRGTPRGTWR
mgnify:CR=1 FL=1